MSIPSLFNILLKMTLENISVTFVRRNENKNLGSTIVQILVILLIPNVFLGNTQIKSLELLTHLTITHNPSL